MALRKQGQKLNKRQRKKTSLTKKPETQALPKGQKSSKIQELPKEILMEWQAPEFSRDEVTTFWLIIGGVASIAMVIWAVWQRSPIMGITFGLFAFLVFFYLKESPKLIKIIIKKDGIKVGEHFYAWPDLESFEIKFSPPRVKNLILYRQMFLIPPILVELADQDPKKIKEILLGYLKERKEELVKKSPPQEKPPA